MEIMLAVFVALLYFAFGLLCFCSVYGMAWRACDCFLVCESHVLGFFSFGCGIVCMSENRYMWVVDGVEMRAGSLYHQKYRVIVAGDGLDLVRSRPKVKERMLCTST